MRLLATIPHLAVFGSRFGGQPLLVYWQVSGAQAACERARTWHIDHMPHAPILFARSFNPAASYKLVDPFVAVGIAQANRRIGRSRGPLLQRHFLACAGIFAPHIGGQQQYGEDEDAEGNDHFLPL